MNIQTIPVGPIGTNCYLVTDEKTKKTVIIDPGAKSARLKRAMEETGVENIAAVLLTHGHFDHVMGLPMVKELTGAPVYIHEADAVFLEPGGPNHRFFRSDPAGKPDRLLREGDTIECGALVFSVLSTPGHTPGGCCYLCEDVIFSGDTLFYRETGRADFPYSDYEEELRSLEKLRALPGDYTVFPGHGRSTTLQEEREKNPYMNR